MCLIGTNWPQSLHFIYSASISVLLVDGSTSGQYIFHCAMSDDEQYRVIFVIILGERSRFILESVFQKAVVESLQEKLSRYPFIRTLLEFYVQQFLRGTNTCSFFTETTAYTTILIINYWRVLVNKNHSLVRSLLLFFGERTEIKIVAIGRRIYCLQHLEKGGLLGLRGGCLNFALTKHTSVRLSSIDKSYTTNILISFKFCNYCETNKMWFVTASNWRSRILDALI